MKKAIIFLSVILLSVACDEGGLYRDDYDSDEEVPEVADPIQVSSPKPEKTIEKVTLTPEQQSYVAGSNAFAFKCLSELYNAAPGSMVFSPLSLQYALAMTVNGASGETAAEITKALGFNADLEALNAYCNLLLNQLPALDPQVDVRLADALVVDKGYPLLPSYKETVESVYYAPVEYMSFSDKKAVVDRINEWAHRNTNGLIFPFLKESDLNEDTIATILNALYFKAPWYNPHGSALFMPEATLEGAEFFLDGGGKAKADLMQTGGYFGYAERDGYRIIEIPYAGGKFAMYVLLPDKVGGNGLKNLISGLSKESWEEISKSLTYSTKVNLRFPKFETASRFVLLPTLNALGIRKAFGGDAGFDRMFDGKGSFFIGNVIQKAKIKVSEWGTEAAAVTVVMLDGASGIVPKTADFFADHPFAYVIAEKSSGTILFEGVFTGE